MIAFNHQIATVNIINGTNRMKNVDFQSLTSAPVYPLQPDYGNIHTDATIIPRNGSQTVRHMQYSQKPSTHQRRPSTAVSRWLAEATQSDFSRVHVRGEEEFDQLVMVLQSTPEAYKHITSVVFEGADDSQTTVLAADVFAAVVCPMWNIQSVTLRRLRLHRRMDTQPFHPLDRTVRELCVDTVEPIDVQAVLDVLSCVPRLINLRLSNVSGLDGPTSTQAAGSNFWDVDFLQRLPPPRPQLIELQTLELRSVCLSKFYLNLVRSAFRSQAQDSASRLTTLVAACSHMDDIEAMDALLFYSRSLTCLSVDLSGCFRFGLPSVEDDELVKACMHNIARCRALKTVVVTTFVSLMRTNNNLLAWRCMCAILDLVPADAISGVEIHIAVGEAGGELSLHQALSALDWKYLRRILLRVWRATCPAQEDSDDCMDTDEVAISLHVGAALPKKCRFMIRDRLDGLPRDVLHLHGAMDPVDDEMEAWSDDAHEDD